jgi:molybdopterin-containing oxidoreductase family iron-sulfur binding subunit
MGASLALAGLGGCAFQEPEQIVPYVHQPEEMLLGRPLNYASAVTLGGYATGVLVKSHEGRPIKVEGNELHPASLGSSDAWTQAAVLELYDPDRSQVVLHNGRVSTWGDLLSGLLGELDRPRNVEGAGLRFLTGTITSPTVARLLNKVLDAFPKSRWHQHEPVGRENVWNRTSGMVQSSLAAKNSTRFTTSTRRR